MPNSIKSGATTNSNGSIIYKNFQIGVDSSYQFGPTATTGFWNGYDFPDNGFVYYQNKSANGPVIYSFPDSSTLSTFASKYLGVTASLTLYLGPTGTNGLVTTAPTGTATEQTSTFSYTASYTFSQTTSIPAGNATITTYVVTPNGFSNTSTSTVTFNKIAGATTQLATGSGPGGPNAIYSPQKLTSTLALPATTFQSGDQLQFTITGNLGSGVNTFPYNGSTSSRGALVPPPNISLSVSPNFTQSVVSLNSSSSPDKIAVNIQYPNIVTSGLTCIVDPGFLPSYPQSGTTIYDLNNTSSTKLNGTLVNSPTFVISGTSGSTYFQTNGTNSYINFSSGNTLNVTSGNSTWNLWYQTTGSTNYYLMSNTSSAAPTVGYYIGVSGGTNVSFNSGTTQAVTATTSTSVNTWSNLCMTKSGNTLTIYNNGTLLTSGTITSLLSSGNLFTIGTNGTNYYNIIFGGLLFYNRALSSTEVSKNFNSYRQRFGI